MKIIGSRKLSAAVIGLLVAGIAVAGWLTYKAPGKRVPVTDSGHKRIAAPRTGGDQGGVVRSPVALALVNSAGKLLKGPSLEDWNAMNDSFSSAEQASKKLTFKLKLPRSTAVGELYGIFVPKGVDDEASIIYGNPEGAGFLITARKGTEGYDPVKIVGTVLKAKEDGSLKANNVPYLLEVNGLQGTGWESGYNYILGEKVPKAGCVSWADNGVVYEIYGTSGESGTSVNELLEIARTISG